MPTAAGRRKSRLPWRANADVGEGPTIIDVGACSTRPRVRAGASSRRRWSVCGLALGTIRQEVADVVLSVDTFRPDVARMAVEEFGADIINDVAWRPREYSMFNVQRST